METMLLLHGAIGAKDQLLPLRMQLADSYTTHSLNFSGHGGEPFSKPFSIPLFAQEVVEYLQQHQLPNCHIMGYSMGGYVGMYLAATQPALVKSLTTLATKFTWNEAIASKEVSMLHVEKITQKLPAFAAALMQRHAPNSWIAVLAKTAEMLQAMGHNNPLQTSDYEQLRTPTLLLVGAEDKMVTVAETATVLKMLANAQMVILPNTPHPIEQVDAALVAHHINHFIKDL